MNTAETMLLTCRLANKGYKILHTWHSSEKHSVLCVSPMKYSKCLHLIVSVCSTNITAHTHQEHNICLLVKCSCHADALALPSRQINTLEICRRKTIRQLQKHQLNINILIGLSTEDFLDRETQGNISKAWARSSAGTQYTSY